MRNVENASLLETSLHPQIRRSSALIRSPSRHTHLRQGANRCSECTNCSDEVGLHESFETSMGLSMSLLYTLVDHKILDLQLFIVTHCNIVMILGV